MTNNYFRRYRPTLNSFVPRGATSSYYAPTLLCLTVRDSTGYKFYPDMVIRPNILDILKTNRWEI